MIGRKTKDNSPTQKSNVNKSKIWVWKQSDTVGCLGPLLVRTADYGRESRLYSSREAGGEGCVWGRCGYEDQRFSFSLPPGLAELLAVTLRREVRTGSWRLHGTFLGY